MDANFLSLDRWQKMFAAFKLFNKPSVVIRDCEIEALFRERFEGFLKPTRFLKKKEKCLPPVERLSVVFFNYQKHKHGTMLRPQPFQTNLCFIDAPLHLVLIATAMLPEWPDVSFAIATVGFELEYPATVLIEQIQGTRCGIDRYDPLQRQFFNLLRTLRWEELLVDILCTWSRRNGFQKIKILKAWRNRWYHWLTFNEHLRQRNTRLKMHYDQTAIRLGFTKSWMYWHKQL